METGEDISGTTPSITSSTALLSSTLSARLRKYNTIEEQKAKLKEKESENKSALNYSMCYSVWEC